MKQPRILLIFLHLFPKIIVCQPLISGEAAASPVPTPLIVKMELFFYLFTYPLKILDPFFWSYTKRFYVFLFIFSVLCHHRIWMYFFFRLVFSSRFGQRTSRERSMCYEHGFHRLSFFNIGRHRGLFGFHWFPSWRMVFWANVIH